MRGTVPVIGDCLNIAVDVRVEVLPTLPVIQPSRDHVPQMRNDACRDEELSFGVIVNTPRVAESMRNDLESFLGRMISPNTAIDINGIV
jgi:hypothetical protein